MHTSIPLSSHKLICSAHPTAPSPPPNSTHRLHASSAGATRAKEQNTSQSHRTSRQHPRATAHAASSGLHLSKHTKRTTLAQQEHTFFHNSNYRNAFDDNERTRATTHAQESRSLKNPKIPHIFALWLPRITVQVVRSDDGPGHRRWYEPSDGFSMLSLAFCIPGYITTFHLTTDDHNSSTRA
jgi:hypothetical protein